MANGHSRHSGRKGDPQRHIGLAGSDSSPPPPRPGLYSGRGSESHESVDLSEYWAVLRRNFLWVLGIALVVWVAVMAITLRSRMQFVSSGRLYLGELDRSGEGGASSAELAMSGHSKGDMGSEVEILRSRSLVRSAVLASGLNARVTPTGVEPPRFWQWLASNRDPDLLDQAIEKISVRGVSFTEEPLDPRMYTIAMVTDETYELRAGGRPIGTGSLGVPLATQELELLVDVGVQGGPTCGATYDVVVSPIELVVDQALAGLEVATPKAANGAEVPKVVTLTFSETSPHMAASFVDHLMRGYLEARQAWKTEDAAAAEEFVTRQLQGMRSSLGQIEEKLADYRSENRVVVMENEADAMIEQIGKYEDQRVAARLEVAALADARGALDRPDTPVEAYMLGEAHDSVLQGMAAALSQQRQALAELETQFHGTAPNVREQRAKVQAQLAAIRNYVTNRLARARGNLATLNSVIGQYEKKLRTVPGVELKLQQLARESDVYGSLYSYLLERQQQAAITKASRVSKNRILDRPKVPRREDSPKLGLRLASGPLGLVFGTVLVLLASLLRGTFESESQVRRAAGTVPVFAHVPRRQKGSRARSVPQPIFGPEGPDVSFGFVEAFRTLRTNLYLATQREQAGQVVLITSPTPGDGKTTCALALASVLAADGKRVLVIDVDLRKPTYHLLVGAEGGLRAVLDGRRPWFHAARTVTGEFGTFYCLGVDHGASAEFLSGQPMRDLLAELRVQCDYVLLDAAPFPLVSDALVLSAEADCMLSVVRLQKTPRREAAAHLGGLAEVPVHAVVVNDAATSGRYGGEYPISGPGKAPGPPSPDQAALRPVPPASNDHGRVSARERMGSTVGRLRGVLPARTGRQLG